MKAWKIAIAVSLKVTATGLVAATTYAATLQQASKPYGTNGGIASHYGRYSDETMGSSTMNGYGSSPYNGYGHGLSNYRRCMGALTLP